jgi:hypothetical protein
MRSVLSSALFCCIASIFPFRLWFRFRFRFRFGLWLRFWFRLGFWLRLRLGFGFGSAILGNALIDL